MASSIAARFSPEPASKEEEGGASDNVEDAGGDIESDMVASAMSAEEYLEVYDRLTQAAAKAAAIAVKNGHGVGYTFPNIAASMAASKLTKAAAVAATAAAMQGPEALAATTAHVMGTTLQNVQRRPSSRRASAVAMATVAAATAEAKQEAAATATLYSAEDAKNESTNGVGETITVKDAEPTNVIVLDCAEEHKNPFQPHQHPSTTAEDRTPRPLPSSPPQQAVQAPTALSPTTPAVQARPNNRPHIKMHTPGETALFSPDTTSRLLQSLPVDSPRTLAIASRTTSLQMGVQDASFALESILAATPPPKLTPDTKENIGHEYLAHATQQGGAATASASASDKTYAGNVILRTTAANEPAPLPQPTLDDLSAPAEVQMHTILAENPGSPITATMASQPPIIIPPMPSKKKRIHKERYIVKGVSKRWDTRGGGRMKCVLHFNQRFHQCPKCSLLCVTHREEVADCPKCNEGLKSFCSAHVAARAACEGCGPEIQQPQKK